MVKKKDKIVYEVTIKMYESGRVCTTEEGHDLLVSKPVALHLNIGLMQTMLTHLTNNMFKKTED